MDRNRITARQHRASFLTVEASVGPEEFRAQAENVLHGLADALLDVFGAEAASEMFFRHADRVARKAPPVGFMPMKLEDYFTHSQMIAPVAQVTFEDADTGRSRVFVKGYGDILVPRDPE